MKLTSSNLVFFRMTSANLIDRWIKQVLLRKFQQGKPGPYVLLSYWWIVMIDYGHFHDYQCTEKPSCNLDLNQIEQISDRLISLIVNRKQKLCMSRICLLALFASHNPGLLHWTWKCDNQNPPKTREMAGHI